MARHTPVFTCNRAKDGRNFKRRRQGKLNEVIAQVHNTKKELPIPGDVIKTAGSKLNLSVSYNVAWRSLFSDSYQRKKESILNFQLIRPYLDKTKDVNPHSVMGCTVNGPNSEIMEIHFFPGHCRDVLKCVRPLISLDAAHLKSDHMGMLYVATVLSGGNDIYPIGFMISMGKRRYGHLDKDVMLPEGSTILTRWHSHPHRCLDAV